MQLFRCDTPEDFLPLSAESFGPIRSAGQRFGDSSHLERPGVPATGSWQRTSSDAWARYNSRSWERVPVVSLFTT